MTEPPIPQSIPAFYRRALKLGWTDDHLAVWMESRARAILREYDLDVDSLRRAREYLSEAIYLRTKGERSE